MEALEPGVSTRDLSYRDLRGPRPTQGEPLGTILAAQTCESA